MAIYDPRYDDLMEAIVEDSPHTYTLRTSQPLTKAQLLWIAQQFENMPSEEGWPFNDIPQHMFFDEQIKDSE